MATYQTIIDKAEIILQDEDSDQTIRRWPETELLQWAKDAETQVVLLKPDSNPVIATVLLDAGSIQSLPTRGVQLLDVLCNMGTSGSTRGDVVEVVEKKLMNAVNPGWMSDTADTTVTHVIYDTKRAPKKFWVYPKSPGTNYLEIMTSSLPDNSGSVIGSSIVIPDEYVDTMVQYILAFSFMKDTDIPQSAARSQLHMTLFMGALGRKHAGEEAYTPKKNNEAD